MVGTCVASPGAPCLPGLGQKMTQEGARPLCAPEQLRLKPRARERYWCSVPSLGQLQEPWEWGGWEQPGYNCCSSGDTSALFSRLCPGPKGRAGATHSSPSPAVPPHLAPGWLSLLQPKGNMPQKAGRSAQLLLIACSLCSRQWLYWEFSWNTWL